MLWLLKKHQHQFSLQWNMGIRMAIFERLWQKWGFITLWCHFNPCQKGLILRGIKFIEANLLLWVQIAKWHQWFEYFLSPLENEKCNVISRYWSHILLQEWFLSNKLYFPWVLAKTEEVGPNCLIFSTCTKTNVIL